jgi:GT2 family glycosyltransferase
MTAHNRKDTTVHSLQTLFSCHLPQDFSLDVFITDDGSTDGTADAIRAQFPQVNVLNGDGQLWWGGGMRLAMDAALAHGFDYYLWLNDDVSLYNDSLARAVNCAELAGTSDCLVVGSTRDPSSGKCSRGGARRVGWWRPMKFTIVEPTDELTACDTICGSFVVIPEAVAHKVGTIDPKFRHQLGDYDYGLRAVKSKCRLLVMPDFIGECPDDTHYQPWKYAGSIKQMWTQICSPKGFPPGDWYLFCARHGGPAWPIFFVSPYIKHIFQSLFNSYRR